MLYIKILGAGCANCRQLETNTREAIKQLFLEAKVEKVEDIAAIMQYDVLRTPALVVDESVIVSGCVPTVSEIVSMLTGCLSADG